MKSNKSEILKLYFDDKLKQVEIAKKLNISNNAVSKVLKKDDRFEIEKARRKKINKKNRNKKIQAIVESKRKLKKNDINDLVLKAMHNQASFELSGGKNSISNRAFRDWNTSIYKYNEKSKSYVLRKNVNVGFDVPKKIKWS